MVNSRSYAIKSGGELNNEKRSLTKIRSSTCFLSPAPGIGTQTGSGTSFFFDLRTVPAFSTAFAFSVSLGLVTDVRDPSGRVA